LGQTDFNEAPFLKTHSTQEHLATLITGNNNNNNDNRTIFPRIVA